MTGYFLAGIATTACVFLALGLLRSERRFTQGMAQYEGRIELLRRERETLLHTALNAQGVQVIEPQQPGERKLAAVAAQSLREKVTAKMAELARDDERRALDRDAQIAQEIEDRKREAEEARGNRGTTN